MFIFFSEFSDQLSLSATQQSVRLTAGEMEFRQQRTLGLLVLWWPGVARELEKKEKNDIVVDWLTVFGIFTLLCEC